MFFDLWTSSLIQALVKSSLFVCVWFSYLYLCHIHAIVLGVVSALYNRVKVRKTCSHDFGLPVRWCCSPWMGRTRGREWSDVVVTLCPAFQNSRFFGLVTGWSLQVVLRSCSNRPDWCSDQLCFMQPMGLTHLTSLDTLQWSHTFTWSKMEQRTREAPTFIITPWDNKCIQILKIDNCLFNFPAEWKCPGMSISGITSFLFEHTLLWVSITLDFVYAAYWAHASVHLYAEYRLSL